FAPETFAYLHASSTSQMKRFREGLAQLLKEGVAQEYELPDSGTRVPLLGAVGTLQFDVLQYRLETEYNATTRLEPAPWSVALWIRQRSATPVPLNEAPRPEVQLPMGATIARDALGH